MSEKKVPQLSLISPTARGWKLLLRTYRSIQTNLDIEIIYIGPVNYLDDNLIPTLHCFITSSVKSSQCCQIGMYIAKGETVGLLPDDQLFTPYAWDEIYNIYKESNDYKTIVSMDWWEHNRSYQSLVTRFGFQLPTGCSVMSRKFFWELGGYDSSYIKRQFDMDFFMKAVKNGATIKWHSGRFMQGTTAPFGGEVQYLYPTDHFLYENKWAMEEGVLVQKIPDRPFVMDDTIYTVNQGALPVGAVDSRLVKLPIGGS